MRTQCTYMHRLLSQRICLQIKLQGLDKKTSSLASDTVLCMQARLSRFQGANAISSADFYDNGEGGGSGPARTGSDFDITAGDLVNRLSMQVGAAAGCHDLSDCGY